MPPSDPLLMSDHLQFGNGGTCVRLLKTFLHRVIYSSKKLSAICNMDYVSNADSDNSPSVLTSPPAEGGKYPSLSASML